MNHSASATEPASARLPLWTLSLALFGVAGAVNLQAPLYHRYTNGATGSDTLTVTLVFGAYIVGLLPVLTFFGGLAGRFGAKPVSLVAIASSLAATVAVIAAPTLGSLLTARVLQGLGVGLAMPAMTAWLAALYSPEAAARSVGTFTTLGFGAGAMLTSLVAEPTQATPVSYPFFGAALLAVFVGASLLKAPRKHPASVSAGVSRLPHFSRGGVVVGVGLAGGWGAAGLVVSMVPSILVALDAHVWSGPALFGMLVAGALAQLHARRWSMQRALLVGAVIQLGALGCLIIGTARGSAPLVIFGAIVGGAGSHGYTLGAGLDFVATSADESTRSRAVAGYFLVGYLGFAGIPVIAGAVASQTTIVGALSAAGVVIVTGSLFCVGAAYRLLKRSDV